MLDTYLNKISIGFLLLILIAFIIVYLAYYFGKKTERWEGNYKFVAPGVWIKIDQTIICQGKTTTNKQVVIDTGTLAVITNINNQKRLDLRLAKPLDVDGIKIKEVMGIKEYSKFKIMPDILVEKELTEQVKREAERLVK